VVILKGVKVVCFDTLLQVLILKVMQEGIGISESLPSMIVSPKRREGVCRPGILGKEAASY
jgi:hypothetical protein